MPSLKTTHAAPLRSTAIENGVEPDGAGQARTPIVRNVPAVGSNARSKLSSVTVYTS